MVDFKNSLCDIEVFLIWKKGVMKDVVDLVVG